MQAKLVLLYDVPLCIYGTVGVLHVTLFVLLPGMEKKGIPKSSLPFPFFQESFCVKLGRLPKASKASSYRVLLCRAVGIFDNPGGWQVIMWLA